MNGARALYARRILLFRFGEGGSSARSARMEAIQDGKTACLCSRLFRPEYCCLEKY